MVNITAPSFKKVTFLCLSSLIFAIAACSVKQNTIIENKSGSYIYKITKTQKDMDPVVTILVTTYNDSVDVLLPTIMVDRQKSPNSNLHGKYKISVKPGNHRFMGKGMSFLFVETGKINLAKGDSLDIVFRLKQDRSPLIDK